MSFIYMVPIHLSQDSLLIPLGEKISTSFHREARMTPLPIDPSCAYDSSRKQYNSSLLLAKLIEMKPKDSLRILGVTDLDLFIPILTFVFGEAQLNGPTAVVSIHRLKNEFYGLPRNDQLLQERLEKEAVHELGHTFGLRHCPDSECVMHFSNSLQDTDRKRSSFCSRCLELLEKSRVRR